MVKVNLCISPRMWRECELARHKSVKVSQHRVAWGLLDDKQSQGYCGWSLMGH
jgi:hypothetical protein